VTLVRKAAQSAIDAGAKFVFVIIGADAESVARSVAGMPAVRALHNQDWMEGQATSLALGVRAILSQTSCDGALVTLADQPFVDGAALASLISAFDEDHRLVASAYNSTIGVPALFGREFLDELGKLTGDSGAGSWLRARRELVTAIPLEGAALDIDTPSDSALLK
jgi:molybdenum cofactor cytidylyltransferase